MPAAHTIVVFAAIAAAFVAFPGPSNLFVLGHGLRGGPRAGVAAAVGCATGASTYVVATAVGLSALIASSELVFSMLHYAGAAYLLWLGVTGILRAGRHAAPEAAVARSPWRSYRQGVTVELGNPKVALFFLALFPQFVDHARGAAAPQILVLGALFVTIGLLSDATYAVASGRLGGWLAVHPRRRRRQERATGVLYLGLGGWAAASGGR